MYVRVHVWVHVCLCACVSAGPVEAHWMSQSREVPPECWELNRGPLQDQQVLLTSGLSLQHHRRFNMTSKNNSGQIQVQDLYVSQKSRTPYLCETKLPRLRGSLSMG